MPQDHERRPPSRETLRRRLDLILAELREAEPPDDRRDR
jgi:septum formation topological specificity factor MinE